MKITNMMIRPRTMKTMIMKRQTCSMTRKVSQSIVRDYYFSFGWPIFGLDIYEESVAKSEKKVKLVRLCVKGNYFLKCTFKQEH